MDWIKINEDMPPSVTPILAYFSCCDVCDYFIVAEFENDGWFESSTGEDLRFVPTHWMPLPKKPITL